LPLSLATTPLAACRFKIVSPVGLCPVAAVGYGLADEIRSFRPPKPGPEWWLLLDLAHDADDVTRRTACGYDYMAEHTQASRATVFRWLQKLAAEGLIRVVQHSKSAGRGGGKGERAVYEIQVPPRLAARAAAALIEVSPSMRPQSGIRSHKKGPDSDENQVAARVRPDSRANPQVTGNQVSRSMRPPLQDPIGRAPVEGARLRPDQDLIDKEEQNSFIGPEREARRALAAQAGPQPQETGHPAVKPERKKRPAA